MNAKTVVSVVAVLAVLGIGGAVYYLNRPAAEVASIDNALGALDETEDAEDATDAPTADAPTADAATTAEDAGPAAGGAAGGDVSGTWAVDTSIGTFDFGDATSTFVGFRVDEELSTVGQTEAVGRTPGVAGELVIDGTQVSTAAIEADFTQLVSDIPNRDGAMRRAINVTEHPSGTFTLTQPVDIGEIPAEGETFAFTAIGELTVNGLTNPVQVQMEAQVAQGNILVVGSLPVVFADYDVTAPQAGPVVSIDDEGTVEMQLWFSRN